MSKEITIDRAARSTTSRTKDERRKPWAPPSRLDAPPAPEGFEHRWIRAEVNGHSDKQNVYSKLREGYEFVRLEEVPEEYQDMLPTIEDGKHAGVISVGGLMLARIPKETLKERADYFRKKAQDQLSAVDNELMRENAHSSMRIQSPERSSRTTFRQPQG
jgi:hypothetical protein|tara:strand:- start:13184 stop:13663 length:480 start_codon:yes stop_codon:yes gene_type:complete